MLERDQTESEWDILDSRNGAPAEIRFLALNDDLYLRMSDVELIALWMRFFGFSTVWVDNSDGRYITKMVFENDGNLRTSIPVIDESNPEGSSIVSFRDWQEMLKDSKLPFIMHLYYPDEFPES